MSYFCDICNYKTTSSGNFSNHKKTQKHILKLSLKKSQDDEKTIVNIPKLSNIIKELSFDDNSKLKLTCPNCNSNFSHKSNLSRHKKNCKINDNKLLSKIEILEKEKELEKREKELYQKLEKEKSEMLKDKDDFINNLMANANNLINKANDNTKVTAQAMQNVSMSALKYANEKFKDTPALLPIENFSINNLSFDNKNDRKQLTELLVYNAKQKSLDKLLGDHIVKEYKKDDPKEQAFHTTDCSRLNYIVRELIENALIWSMDKSGIKICSSIVKPLIEKCINLLLEHQKYLIDEMATGQFNNKETVQTIISVLMSIDRGSLESEVNKYIAPFFNLNKSN